MLSSPYFKIQLRMVESAADQQGCYLEGVTLQEEQLFLELLEEALGPIDNPRYLIVRKHYDGETLLSVQHYAVPGLFGQRRAFRIPEVNSYRAFGFVQACPKETDIVVCDRPPAVVETTANVIYPYDICS